MCSGAGVSSFELDLEGGAEVLKVVAADAMRELGLQVAAAADEGATVEEYAQVSDRVTDRFVVSVSVPAERQAKDGALTKAAASVGLEVRLRPGRQRRRGKKAPET